MYRRSSSSSITSCNLVQPSRTELAFVPNSTSDRITGHLTSHPYFESHRFTSPGYSEFNRSGKQPSEIMYA